MGLRCQRGSAGKCDLSAGASAGRPGGGLVTLHSLLPVVAGVPGMIGEDDLIPGKDCLPWISARIWAAVMSFSFRGVKSSFLGISRNDAYTSVTTWMSFWIGGRGVSDAAVSLNDSSDGTSEE